MGDYHLGGDGVTGLRHGRRQHPRSAGARTTGSAYTVAAPTTDIDGDQRPSPPPRRYDAGSDQLTP